MTDRVTSTQLMRKQLLRDIEQTLFSLNGDLKTLMVKVNQLKLLEGFK